MIASHHFSFWACIRDLHRFQRCFVKALVWFVRCGDAQLYLTDEVGVLFDRWCAAYSWFIYFSHLGDHKQVRILSKW